MFGTAFLVLAGIASLVVFVCVASEGDDGESEAVNQRQRITCLAIAGPAALAFGGAGLVLLRPKRPDHDSSLERPHEPSGLA